MKHSIKTGFSFGLTSAIITTLGLMVGLNSGTRSRIAVLGGVLTIAIADAFSDSLSIHISEESENQHTTREIWEATFSTFLSKFFFASIFIIPIILFNLSTAIVISVVWGLLLLAVLSFFIARDQKTPSWKVVTEHLFIAVLVIGITHYIGIWIASIL